MCGARSMTPRPGIAGVGSEKGVPRKKAITPTVMVVGARMPRRSWSSEACHQPSGRVTIEPLGDDGSALQPLAGAERGDRRAAAGDQRLAGGARALHGHRLDLADNLVERDRTAI